MPGSNPAFFAPARLQPNGSQCVTPVMSADLSQLDMVMRLGAALVCGAVIGLERDMRHMPTGMRTLSLVAIGSCAAVLAASFDGDSAGFTRIAQGIVTGVGFLGGGVILQKGDLQDVKGLTTAASIWFTATVGLLCGVGAFLLAGVATLLAVLLLIADHVIDPLFDKHKDPEPPKDEPHKTAAND